MITPFNRPEAEKLLEIAQGYFNKDDNKPFTVAGACLALGLDLPTLHRWSADGNENEKALVWFLRYSVLADMEKGDKWGAANSSLYTPIVNRYFSDELGAVEEDELVFEVIRVGEQVRTDG